MACAGSRRRIVDSVTVPRFIPRLFISRPIISRPISWALIALGLTSGPGVGQVPDSARIDSVFTLEDLRVTAVRPLASPSGASAVRLDMSVPHVEPVPLLEEALRRIPFLQVRENSRGEAQVTLRGTESRQIAVLLDGVPLTLGWDARTDLSLIPVDAAREIQFFRGMSSVLHGPNVLGGVIHIDVGRGEERSVRPSTGIQGGVDQTGALFAGGRIGHQVASDNGGLLSIQGGVGWRSRDYVRLPSGIGTAYEGGDDDRTNSDLLHRSAFVTGRYSSPTGGWLAASAFAYDAEKGVPPELHVSDPRLWRIPDSKRGVLVLSGGTPWGQTPFGTGDFEISLGFDSAESQIDAFESLLYNNVVDHERATDRTLTFRGLSDHQAGIGVFRTALTVASTRRVQEEGAGGRERYSQRLLSLAGEYESPLGEGDITSRIRLSAGASFDHASTPDAGGREPRDPIGDVGLRIGGSLLLGSETVMHAGLSRRVRFPSLRELYSGALGRFVPNQDLAPEVLRTAEGGMTSTLSAFGGSVDVQGVLFTQVLSDAIVRQSFGDGRFRRENRSRVDATGIEMLADAQWEHTALGGSMTWQNVGLADPAAAPGARPEYQPELSASAYFEQSLGGFRARVAGRFMGSQYCEHPDLGKQLALDASAVFDAAISREFMVGGRRLMQLSVLADNLTHAAVFDQCGLPQPGRTLRLQFRLF